MPKDSNRTVENITTGRPTTVRVVDSYDHFTALRQDWDRLVEQSLSDTIFQTFDWNDSWWSVFGSSRRLNVLLVEQGNSLIGICPLMVEAPAGPSRMVLRFIGTPNIDYADVIGPDKRAVWTAVLDYLSESRHVWHQVELTQLSERSDSPSILQNRLLSSQIQSRSRICETCLGFVYEGAKEDRANFRSERGTNVRRAIRHFEQQESFKFERVAPDQIGPVLAEIYQLHINRWQDTATPSKFLDQGNRAFYDELVRRLGPAGRLAVTRLSSDGLPICCSFNFVYRGLIYHYTLAYNKYFHKWSPGNLFIALQSESFVHSGCDLDYSRGVQEYKKLLTNRSWNNYEFCLYSSGLSYSTARFKDGLKQSRIARIIAANRTVVHWRAKIDSLIAREGFGSLLKRVVSRLVAAIVDVRTIIMFRFGGEVDDSITPKVPVVLRQLTERDIPLICTFYGVESTSRKYRTIVNRFAAGSDCFGGFHNGQLISIGWGIYGQDIDSVTGFTLKANQREVIISDGLTSVLYRGMRVRPFLINQEIKAYRAKGLDVITAVDQANTASLRNVLRIGFRQERKIRMINVFGFRINR